MKLLQHKLIMIGVLLHWNGYCQYARSSLKLVCQFNQLHWKQKKEIVELLLHPTTVKLLLVCQWTSVGNEDFCAASKECHRCCTITTGEHCFIQVPLIRFALFHQVMCRYWRDPDLGGGRLSIWFWIIDHCSGTIIMKATVWYLMVSARISHDLLIFIWLLKSH